MAKKFGLFILAVMFLGATFEAPICQTSCALAQSNTPESQQKTSSNESHRAQSPCHGQPAEEDPSNQTPAGNGCQGDACLKQITSQFKYNLKKVSQQSFENQSFLATVFLSVQIGEISSTWNRALPWYFFIPVKAIHLLNQVFRN